MPITVDSTQLASKAADLGIRSNYWSGFGKSDVAEFLAALDVTKDGDAVTIKRAKDAIYDGSPAATTTV